MDVTSPLDCPGQGMSVYLANMKFFYPYAAGFKEYLNGLGGCPLLWLDQIPCRVTAFIP